MVREAHRKFRTAGTFICWWGSSPTSALSSYQMWEEFNWSSCFNTRSYRNFRYQITSLVFQKLLGKMQYSNLLCSADCNLVEAEDHVEVNGEVFPKPFVEKPVCAEDHNVYIYYPTSAGGGSQRLFRKVSAEGEARWPISSLISWCLCWR